MWQSKPDGSAVLMMGGWEFWLPKEIVLTVKNCGQLNLDN
jgi:hypothetical protein